MSDGRGTRVGLAAAGVLGLFALLNMNGADSTPFTDETRTCSETDSTSLLPYEECRDGHPYCPAPMVCATPASTTSVVASIVPEASSTTQVAEMVTVAPETTVVPVAPRPNSEAAPKPSDAPVADPPPTEPPPPATEPAPAGIDWDKCPRIATVQAGDNSWSILADRLDVWTRDLLARNQATKDTPLLVGARICAPPSVYGDGPATTAATPTTQGTLPPEGGPPTTLAPQLPPTQAPPTTEQRRSPGGERTTTTVKPTWAQTPSTAPPTTKAAQEAPKQPQAPPTAPDTTRVAPGTVRTTLPRH